MTMDATDAVQRDVNVKIKKSGKKSNQFFARRQTKKEPSENLLDNVKLLV